MMKEIKCTRCNFKSTSERVMKFHVGNIHEDRLNSSLLYNWEEL